MSEHDVMVLAGHANFATTHKFYLAVADDLVYRTRVATTQGLRQQLVRFGTHPFENKKMVDSIFRKLLYYRNLENTGSVAQLVEQRPFKP